MSKTILIVDDSRMSRMLLRKIIEVHQPEWEILEAASGEEAISITDGLGVDIMAIDMNMPGMDGLTLGTALRSRYPEADISLVTANIQETVRAKALAAGMKFIPKPITEERIAGYLRAVA